MSEDSVRRYLQRKPMTTKELLQKFKSKKTGLSDIQLVHAIAQTLKKINHVKETIGEEILLSLEWIMSISFVKKKRNEKFVMSMCLSRSFQ